MADWPYSTMRWQRLRRMQLNRSPMCAYCDDAGRITIATVVDHVVTVREAKHMAFDIDNLQSLCDSCHSGAKQKSDSHGKSGCDIDGNPFSGWGV